MEAEAEILAAITTFFLRLGITSSDVGIKISSRKVLQAVLSCYDVSDESFAPVCVVVDKIEKLPREKIVEELAGLNVAAEAIDGRWLHSFPIPLNLSLVFPLPLK